MDAKVWSDQAGKMRVAGEIGFANAERVNNQGEELLAKMPQVCTIDLSEVRLAGSVLLAIMVAWLRYARQAEIILAFQNVPSDLMQVARVSGLDTVLPISVSAA